MTFTSRINNNPLTDLFSLGDLYVSNFIEPDDNKEYPKQEIKLCLDEISGLVQLEQSTDFDTMYRNYWYSSGTNQSMKNELIDIVRSINLRIPLKLNSNWLDIACNDGTLLENVKNNFTKYGCDPSNVAKENSEKCHHFCNDYFTKEAFKDKKFQVITAIAMFYDLDNPVEFLKDVNESLEDNGLFVMQMSYLPLMLKQLAFDNLCFKPGTKILGCNKNIENIEVGDKVLNKNGELVKVIKKFNNNFSGNLKRIKATYISPLECTPEHPILSLNKNKIDFPKGQRRKNIIIEEVWKKASELNIGDYICIPKINKKEFSKNIDLKKYLNIDNPNHRRGLEEIILTPELAWVLGLYLAEGHTYGKENNKQVCFTLNKNEEDLFVRIKKYFESIGYKTNKTYSKVNNSMCISVSCSSLAKFLREKLGKNALEKNIPDFILYNKNDDIVLNFLNGFVCGDGFVSDKNGKNTKNNSQINCRTSSSILKDQLQLLFASFKIMMNICYVPETTSEIRGKVVNTKESWILRGKANSKLFETKYNQKNKYYLENERGYWVKINHIEEIPYNGPVYNMETETNSYVVSNIVTHNCHEHLCYYTLSVIKNIYEKAGLKIVDAQINDVNGGSFRVYAQKESAKVTSFGTAPYRDVANFRINSILNYENRLDLKNPRIYKDFFNRIQDLKDKTYNFIKSEKEDGKTIIGYGASTKGNTLLQYFGLDNSLITAIAERQPKKYGLKTIGTNIPIVSEDEARTINPDYFLILPWHFIYEFRQREASYLKCGGKFIVPCPNFEIIES